MLWYATRATGLMAMMLFSGVTLLGILTAGGLRSKRIPHAAVALIHRNISLLSVMFLAVHIGTTVADNYVNVNLSDVFVPFFSDYRPIWVGLGSIAVDLMLAILVTSLLRRRIPREIWRAIHWLAYGSWGIALAHSITIGTDALATRTIAVISLASVAAALVFRFWNGLHPEFNSHLMPIRAATVPVPPPNRRNKVSP